jgi:hypothetical protein
MTDAHDEYRLPDLPPHFVWHVSARSEDDGQRFSLVLCDGSVHERLAFRRENPGEAREGTPAYEKLLTQGVQVGRAAKVKSWRKLRRRAEKMAEAAWVVWWARLAEAERVGRTTRA